MSTPADRFRTVAATFTERIEGVGADGWDSPAPCEGWVARDIVQHLADWIPGFFGDTPGVELQPGPAVVDDPAGAWAAIRDRLQAALDDPGVGEREFSGSMMGTMPLDVAIERFVTGDVLVHTWDLARATGQDETIDAEMAALMYTGMEPMAEMLAGSGQFGPRTPVAADASIQDKLLALTGRTP